MNSIVIKPVTGLADIEQLEQIQRETWGMSDLEMIPARFMHSMQFNGACLLGAYDGDKMVGFVFGLLGTDERLEDRVDEVAAARLLMYSAISGVLPAYQSTGVGQRLKMAQREFALRIGVRLITWTYDPLESRNAYFNIVKLGVICQNYVRNYHGEMGGINAGLPTDRFYVEWWITSKRAQSRAISKRRKLNLEAFTSAGSELINAAERRANGLLAPPSDYLDSSSRIVLVEIPTDIQIIKREDMNLASAWRQHTRHLFEHYFLGGYLVTDFVRHKDTDDFDRSYYVLTRMDAR
jgi:predicted GNAT superfamily acetyltransferase